MKLLIPMDPKDFGAFLAYKYNAKFNYYLFVEGINVLLFLIFIGLSALTLFLVYEPTLGDYIIHTKNIYTGTELVMIIVFLVVLGLISCFASSKEKLKRDLKIICAITLLSILFLIGIKIGLNKKYTKETFSNIYENQVINKNDKKILTFNLFDINSDLIQQKSEKDIFVQQSVKAYKYFSIKATFLIIVICFIFILEFYMLTKVFKKIELLNRIQKDDNILEDDEINVKY